jgi:hypothetical protein
MTLCLSMIEDQARAVGHSIGAQVDEHTLELRIHIQNGCNLREHWAARSKRVRKERSAVAWGLLAAFRHWRPTLPCTVTLTRLAPRKLDSDNAVAGFKAVRDEVAVWLGVNDNDPRVTWRYAQEKAKAYAARIQIEEAP